MPFTIPDAVWTYLKPLGELTIVLGGIAALWKFFTDRKLKAIEGRFAVQIARLTDKLSRQREGAVHVFKAKFDLEVKVYLEIWACIRKLRETTFQLSPKLAYSPTDISDDETKNRLTKLFDAQVASSDEVIQAMLKYQPFYPKDIYDKIWEFDKTCRTEAFRFEEAFQLNRNRYDERWTENEEKIKTLYEGLSDIISNRIESLSVIEDEKN